MPPFVCDSCGCVEKTATSCSDFYLQQRLNLATRERSECGTDRWHGFLKRAWAGTKSSGHENRRSSWSGHRQGPDRRGEPPGSPASGGSPRHRLSSALRAVGMGLRGASLTPTVCVVRVAADLARHVNCGRPRYKCNYSCFPAGYSGRS